MHKSCRYNNTSTDELANEEGELGYGDRLLARQENGQDCAEERRSHDDENGADSETSTAEINSLAIALCCVGHFVEWKMLRERVRYVEDKARRTALCTKYPYDPEKIRGSIGSR
jgi:hypothetical protein